MLSKYVSTNWRADIANDCQDFEQEANTWFFYPKFLLTFFRLRRPGREETYLDGKAKPFLQFMWHHLTYSSCKNTDFENECAGFEKIDDEQPKTTTKRPTNRSQNQLRLGITLQAWRSTSYVIDQRGTARQWNSRQRRGALRIWWLNRHPAFHEPSENLPFHARTGSDSFPASPVGRMFHFIDFWHYLNVFECRQILLTDVQVSKTSMRKQRKQPSPDRPFDRKTTLGVVLVYKHGALRVM